MSFLLCTRNYILSNYLYLGQKCLDVKLQMWRVTILKTCCWGNSECYVVPLPLFFKVSLARYSLGMNICGTRKANSSPRCSDTLWPGCCCVCLKHVPSCVRHCHSGSLLVNQSEHTWILLQHVCAFYSFCLEYSDTFFSHHSSFYSKCLRTHGLSLYYFSDCMWLRNYHKCRIAFPEQSKNHCLLSSCYFLSLSAMSSSPQHLLLSKTIHLFSASPVGW